MTFVKPKTALSIVGVAALLLLPLFSVVKRQSHLSEQNHVSLVEKNQNKVVDIPNDLGERSSADKTEHDYSRIQSETGTAAGNPVPANRQANNADGHDNDEGDILLDSFEDTVNDFPDTPVGQLLQSVIAATEGLGPDAENHYQSVLDELREHHKEAIHHLFEAYDKMEEDRYLDRWKVIDTMAVLGSNLTLEALTSIAGEYIPNERYPGSHDLSSRSEEAMIREAAIRGIEALAKKGNNEAENALFDLTNSSDTAIREIAVLAYIRSGSGDGQRQLELNETLDADDHGLLNLQELSDISLMPQPTDFDETPNEKSVENTTGDHSSPTKQSAEAADLPPIGY